MKILVLLSIFIFSVINCNAENYDKKETKTLILYYSQTGVTKQVAEELQRRLRADIEEIEVTNPYNGTYEETIGRCIEERKKDELPHIRPLKSDLKKYRTIFLGYPIWFGTYARPVITLVKSFKFANREIIPFCTFGSGGLIESTNNLKKDLPLAYVKDGFGIREARISRVKEELDRFLKLNGFITGTVEIFQEYSEQRPVNEEDKIIFSEACSSYKYPLGTPIAVSCRKTNKGMDYLFISKGKTPDGKEVNSKIYVTVENNQKPEFTMVVR